MQLLKFIFNDANLNRLSHFAQVATVGILFYGYFHTVEPLYQKDVIAEELARKEIELEDVKSELNDSRKLLINARNEYAKQFVSFEELKGKVNEEKIVLKKHQSDVANLSQEIETLSEKKAELENVVNIQSKGVILSSGKVASTDQELKKAAWERYLSLARSRITMRLMFASIFSNLNTDQLNLPSQLDESDRDIYSKPNWVFLEVADALKSVEKKDIAKSIDISNEEFEKFKSYALLKAEQSLSKIVLDDSYILINKRYEQEVANKRKDIDKKNRRIRRNNGYKFF